MFNLRKEDVIGYLEEKLIKNIATDEEYDLYLTYKNEDKLKNKRVIKQLVREIHEVAAF